MIDGKAIKGLRMIVSLPLVVAVVVIATGAGSTPVMTDVARNPHHFTLQLDMRDFVNGGWSGDADLKIDACGKPACFHLSGPVKLPINPSTGLNEGKFPVPGSQCDIRLVEAPHQGMDSGDWRLTLINKGAGRTGCALLPAGLAGVYRQVV